MTKTLIIIFFFVSALPILALDQYTFQGDGRCETEITLLAAAAPMNVTVDGVGSFIVDPGATFEIRHPAGNQSFSVTIQSDSPDYSINSSLTCPPPADVDAYTRLESQMFRRMGWGPEEIDWFRNVYTPLYGNPREYIYSMAEGYQVLDAVAPVVPSVESVPVIDPTEVVLTETPEPEPDATDMP